MKEKIIHLRLKPIYVTDFWDDDIFPVAFFKNLPNH